MSEFNIITCCECGLQFSVRSNWYKKLVDSHDTFYCPSGHSQSFTGETDAEKYKRQLDWQSNRADTWHTNADHYKNQARAYKGHCTRLKNKAERDVEEEVVD